jgi:hypothetical protein
MPDPVPDYAPDDGALTQTQIEQVKKIRTRSNRPGTYRATTKKAKSLPEDSSEVALPPPGEFVGVPAEPDPELETPPKSKILAKVTMPTFD